MEASIKPILSLVDTVALVENVTKQLSTGAYDTTSQAGILHLSSNLKHHGPSLESSHHGALDKLQQVLRVACRDKNLDLVSRVHLLEIIELRALKWIPNDHVTNFYKNKLSTIKDEIVGEPPKAPSPLAPIQNNAISHTPSRNGLNADAPEFTFRQSTGSPRINLQQPPIGRKTASQETTALENQSIPEDAQTGNKEKFTVTLKTTDGDVTISSFNKKLFHTARDIIKEKLAQETNKENEEISSSRFIEAARKDKTIKPDLKYSSNKIRELATSPLCLVPPVNWDKIVCDVPSMVKSPATGDQVNEEKKSWLFRQ